MKIFHCEIKRHKILTPALCAICPRIERCRTFRLYYRQNFAEYLDFVTKICLKFPEKYIMEVLFMAEKQSFVQIVDTATGKVERVVDQREIEALSVEDKLALARNKTLYVVSHKLEPVIKVEMRKVNITTPVSYVEEQTEQQEEIASIAEVEIPLEKPSGRGRPRKS
jgi:hypothetical protein